MGCRNQPGFSAEKRIRPPALALFGISWYDYYIGDGKVSDFISHLFSGRQYTAQEIISFSQSPLTHYADIDTEMQYHQGVEHIQVSCLTQNEFDTFVEKYADNYKSIYFFQNLLIRDLSALSSLKNVEYLLFYNVKNAKSLWDMHGNTSLKGIFLSASKKISENLSALQDAPALEEFLLSGTLDKKYVVQSLEPLKNCANLKRVMIDCNTAQQDFDPEVFSCLDTFLYRVDSKRNFSY